MSKSHYGDHEPARSKRILVVEDDPVLGDLLVEALQEEAYEAFHALRRTNVYLMRSFSLL